MKILKILNKKVKNITYYKYRINLPKKIVDKTNLLNSDLIIKEKDGKIIIEKDMSYSESKTLTKREKKLQKELLKIIESGD